MSLPNKYPLEKIVEIRKSKLDKAERALKERKAALVVEEEKLAKVTAERDKVREHRQAKLDQLRAELDRGTTTVLVQRMKAYLKIVEDKIRVEDKKVAAQATVVKECEKKVEEARMDYLNKQRGLEKFSVHREFWHEEQDLLSLREEELRNDEAGTIAHTRKRMLNKRESAPRANTL